MKLLDFILIFISTSLLVVNQVALKFWIKNKNIVVWPLNIDFIINLFSIEILISILSVGISGIMWIALLKKLEFSILYPMISISYVWGVFVSVFVFHESVPFIRWIGVLVILFGIFLISR